MDSPYTQQFKRQNKQRGNIPKSTNLPVINENSMEQKEKGFYETQKGGFVIKPVSNGNIDRVALINHNLSKWGLNNAQSQRQVELPDFI